MEATHNINYEGLELEVKGEFEEAETETGYKGGWSYLSILKDDVDISWMLRPEIIETINEIIVQENY
jgi:hypothetical protein